MSVCIYCKLEVGHDTDCVVVLKSKIESLENIMEAGCNINYHLNYLVNGLAEQAMGYPDKLQSWNSSSTAGAMDSFDKAIAEHKKSWEI